MREEPKEDCRELKRVREKPKRKKKMGSGNDFLTTRKRSPPEEGEE